jgi:hypothetical protein
MPLKDIVFCVAFFSKRIKSPKQSLGDLLFLLRFLLLFLLLLLLLLFFLSAKHELVHGRSQELQDRITFAGVAGVRFYISITPPSFKKFCPVVPEICRGQDFPFMSIKKVIPYFCVLREGYYVIIWLIVRICVFIKD